MIRLSQTPRHETVELPSVRPSVRLYYRSTTAAACGGFAAERRAGRRHRSTVANAGRSAATVLQHGAATRCSAANASSAVSAVDEAEHILVNYWSLIVSYSVVVVVSLITLSTAKQTSIL